VHEDKKIKRKKRVRAHIHSLFFVRLAFRSPGKKQGTSASAGSPIDFVSAA
jgi:hypothetical protein